MRREEAAIQRAIVQHLELRAPKNSVWFAVPNGGQRNIITARNLKLEGVKAGVADLILVRNGQPCALELKKQGGRLSASQTAFRNRWQNAGGVWQAAWGLEPALETLTEWGFLC